MGTNNEETHQKNTTEIILEYISVIEIILLYMNGWNLRKTQDKTVIVFYIVVHISKSKSIQICIKPLLFKTNIHAKQPSYISYFMLHSMLLMMNDLIISMDTLLKNGNDFS